MSTLPRRHVLFIGLGLASVRALSAYGAKNTPAAAPVTPNSPLTIPNRTLLVAAPGAKTVNHALMPRPVTPDLGGVTARTWAYDETLDAPVLRAHAGDLLQVRIRNKLPTSTSIYWYGIVLCQPSDGVPGVTQQSIEVGNGFAYQFVAPDPGTYFFHPHTGAQINRGLYRPLVIDDSVEPGHYNHEWIITLDDWADGVGTSPDDILAALKTQNGIVPSGMNHDMGDISYGMSSLGDVGDTTYLHCLINGRVLATPRTLTAKPGQEVRLHVVNASSDTIFKLALQGYRFIVTHTDGFPVTPTRVNAAYLAMGERLDATIILGNGVFVLQVAPKDKKGIPVRVIVRTSSGNVPALGTHIVKFDGKALLTIQLKSAESTRLPDRKSDTTFDVALNGQIKPHAWGPNGKHFGEDTPLALSRGQHVRLRMTNITMMAHPMRIYGHTRTPPGSDGLRKDTVLTRPMETAEVDLQVDNPGTQMLHCHNIYHTKLDMMTILRY